MLERVLGNTQRRIVEYLTREGERSLSDITERMNLSKPSVSRHLKELVDSGIVKERKKRTRAGRESLYTPNRFALLLVLNPEARSMVSIETQSRFSLPFLLLEQVKDEEFKEDLEVLLSAISRLKEDERPIAIILFGSVAEGKGTWKSDIDVAILSPTWSKTLKGRVEELISDAGMKTKHQVKPHFLVSQQLEGEESMLVKEIKMSGMIIYGDLYGESVPWKEMERYKSITP
ncbi:MAG: ArsR family transcriptional regulator [Thermoplasmata archaeon]|nr:ArsR family transcriptional regulator [Thermoplasmata archaeon]